ncbi:hypothetical protein GCM10019016_046490 [Streptomyces prasinosporus]|uniref:GAF domain-containing protein n=1 Tax=Streptomyces prasinosporus TaxID=68256 RepID=A0ABP6TTX7_9ACTN
MVLPLVARNRVIGMLTLGKPTEEHFRQEILELAEDLSRRAALALDNARLYSERTAISQSLQRSLLPAPSCPTIEGVEVEVIYRAAGEGNEVGGDFYDLFPDQRRRLRLRHRRRLRYGPQRGGRHRTRPARAASARPRGPERPGGPGAPELRHPRRGRAQPLPHPALRASCARRRTAAPS